MEQFPNTVISCFSCVYWSSLPLSSCLSQALPLHSSTCRWVLFSLDVPLLHNFSYPSLLTLPPCSLVSSCVTSYYWDLPGHPTCQVSPSRGKSGCLFRAMVYFRETSDQKGMICLLPHLVSLLTKISLLNAE